MTPQQIKRLEKLMKTLDEGRILIRDLLREEVSNGSVSFEQPQDFDARSLVSTIKSLNRSDAEHRLGQFKQNELGAIFVESGGPASDKKKPKIWLIEQILWRIFDFDRGHEAIRSKGKNEN